MINSNFYAKETLNKKLYVVASPVEWRCTDENIEHENLTKKVCDFIKSSHAVKME